MRGLHTLACADGGATTQTADASRWRSRNRIWNAQPSAPLAQRECCDNVTQMRRLHRHFGRAMSGLDTQG